uniref:CYLIP-Iso-2 n=1 Tax=Isometroides vescus TaxID=1330405 RepID=T1E6X9_9SCOR
MNKRVLLVIFIVTLLVVDEVNSFSFRKMKGLLKRAWKSKLAKKLRSKGMRAFKNYAKDMLSDDSEEVPAAIPDEAPVEEERRRRR